MAKNAQTSLWLTLDANTTRSRAMHTAGDMIKAQVHLQSVQGLNVESLVVRFRGKQKTFIVTGSGDNRRTRKCKVFLFSFERTLIQRNHGNLGVGFGDACHSWNVEFQFPTMTMPHASQSVMAPESHAVFEWEPGHALPPSFSAKIGSHSQSIEYYLEAEMNPDSHLFRRRHKFRVPLPFSPSRQSEAPPPPPLEIVSPGYAVSCSSRLLDPVKAAQPYGLVARLFPYPHRNPDPTAHFAVGGSVPTHALAGQPLPVVLRFTYDPSKSTAPQEPPVYLAHLWARMTVVTDYRVAPLRVIGGKRKVERQDSRKVDLLICQNVNARLFDGLNDLAGIINPPIRIPADLPPNFTSFNICRSYLLKISVTLKCADKTFEVDIVRRLPFVIHPALYRDPSSGIACGGTVDRRLIPRRESVDTLPPYEDVNWGRE